MDQIVENKIEVTIHSQERLDELHRKGYRIIQDPGRFCFGMDAVLLSGFAKVKRGERALDLGTGTGIIPILLEAKTAGEHFTGLEIQPESADMAERSVAYNHLEDKIEQKEDEICVTRRYSDLCSIRHLRQPLSNLCHLLQSVTICPA